MIAQRIAKEDADQLNASCWPKFGAGLQSGAWIVAIALIAIMVPVACINLPQLKEAVGLLPYMETDAPSTKVLIDLQNSFGVGAIFPTEVVVMPNVNTSSLETRGTWLKQACKELNSIADEVNEKVKGLKGIPPFTNKSFVGAIMLDGKCQPDNPLTAAKYWSNHRHPYSATVMTIQYAIDPFSTNGLQWIAALGNAFTSKSATKVAKWQSVGAATIQNDCVKETYSKLPTMVILTMSCVFVVIAIAFKSLVAPVRAVFCLLWMLIITFGLAILVYQDGMLSFLNWNQLGKRDTGAMYWISPVMVGPMMIGLGLDYDIFYSERVVEEWEHGYSEKDAAARALAKTANVISAAGCIMVIAFGALLVSTTPSLNEMAFLLIVGVFIDCFVTTKIIIPCAMSLLGKLNFWPRKRRQRVAALSDRDIVRVGDEEERSGGPASFSILQGQ